jgi:hypothetical protein
MATVSPLEGLCWVDEHLSVSISSEMSGNVTNVVFRNSTAYGTETGMCMIMIGALIPLRGTCEDHARSWWCCIGLSSRFSDPHREECDIRELCAAERGTGVHSDGDSLS